MQALEHFMWNYTNNFTAWQHTWTDSHTIC